MFSAFESSVQEPLVAGKKFLNRTVLGQDLPLATHPEIGTGLAFSNPATENARLKMRVT